MRRAALVAVALAIAACGGGGGSDTARSTGAGAEVRQPPVGPAPRLTVSHPCDNATGFTCSTLAVALDHSGRTHGDHSRWWARQRRPLWTGQERAAYRDGASDSLCCDRVGC